MALRLSGKLRDDLMKGSGLAQAMSNCVLKVYTGAQPATAESAPTGALLCTYSNASGAVTREVLASGSVALTGGASGSVNTLTVGGIEIMGSATNFNTSLTQTAADIATKINNNPQNRLWDAANNGTATVTITARPGLGALGNLTVASTVTTITKTDTNTTGGVTAVNGLNWGSVAGGILSSLATQVWSGVAGAGGTAGWFRIEAAVADAGGVDTTESVRRIDGAIGTSGAELNMGNTTITSGTTQTITSFALSLPTA
jgi:hypothetical protein